MTTTRKLLPIISDGPHGSRSAVTCFYRCGNACDHPEPNTSGNTHVSALIEGALARRAVLRGAAVGAGVIVVGHSALGSAAAAPHPDMISRGQDSMADAGDNPATGQWTPVAPNVRDELSVPSGYATTVVASWGDPVVAGAPVFDPLKQTPESAALQFGYNCDYVGILPLDRKHSLLVVNHEYTNEELMFPGDGTYDADTIRKIAIQSHGMSVLKIKRRRNGSFEAVHPRESAYNRRITGTSKFKIVGPAVGDARLKTTTDPSGQAVLGTFNNCAGGITPWGTVLSGEENFNQYFESTTGTLDPRYTTSYKRYGIAAPVSRGWSGVDPRFDLSKEPHEPFRFGWIVEIDPYDRRSTPRKHTMLGRFKHEGANVTISDDGYAVAYMGDDERGDYLYKFVSKKKFRRGDSGSARRHNLTLLTEGTLYVAKLTGDGTEDGEFDGTGEWIALTSDSKSFVDGMSVADVLIDTRLAADKVAPTKMDRPEDVDVNPVNGKIYAALTNNSNRGTTFPVDEANPIAESHTRDDLDGPLIKKSGNRNGYVLELTEDGSDHSGTTFRWTLLLVCGDPEAPETYFAGFPKDKVSPISCPDNVAFDSRGNLWVSTDGNVLGSNDGIFRVPLRGSRRGQVQQFLSTPVAAEACGPFISHRDEAVWVAVQHPGEATGSTYDQPVSTWPHTHDFPRPSVAVAYRR
jgi:secreted PhoX family phosphatase